MDIIHNGALYKLSFELNLIEFVYNPSKIHEICKTNFIASPNSPIAVRLSETTVLLINIRKYSVYCANGTSTHLSHCLFCQINLRCDCSLKTESFLLPARLQNCEGPIQNSRQELINLRILFELFGKEKLATFDGATKFNRIINISLPSFQVSANVTFFLYQMTAILEF